MRKSDVSTRGEVVARVMLALFLPMTAGVDDTRRKSTVDVITSNDMGAEHTPLSSTAIIEIIVLADVRVATFSKVSVKSMLALRRSGATSILRSASLKSMSISPGLSRS